ncbi:hypothetical protein [Bradyrhizobium sp. NAS80.1]|uniref:hypothetical protein n=1 Tax=Bradyrhizobium sp. NAS80.1 TaxID=1680159 RepID=UPI00143E066D|nr:hypothetical protein [Bradyrhizobium sp. NAS80.1]
MHAFSKGHTTTRPPISIIRPTIAKPVPVLGEGAAPVLTAPAAPLGRTTMVQERQSARI